MAYRLLFVCLGNICRSPAAENMMNHLLRQEQLETVIVCDSAGTSSYHIGSAPDRRMTLAAKARGIELTGKARQFTAHDFEDFDLILAMDRANYRDILAIAPQSHYQPKVKLMGDYALNHRASEVPDPYYGGQEGFNQVLDLLEDACQGLLAEIRQTQGI
jgi:protein-tyrosine phosphatase